MPEKSPSDRAAEAESVAATTEAYYDSSEADSFYAVIWGGEDIHIGVYQHAHENVAQASARTVDTMKTRLGRVDSGCRVLDIGSGYGGAGRALARAFECQVDCLNLSEVQNERNRNLTRKAGLDDRVHVVHANFEAIPGPDAVYDVVWSQDAILHSGNRERVLSEVARVLKPGGRFIFTDPMQTDNCPPDVLQPVLDRIHLDSLASPSFYRKNLALHRLEERGFVEMPDQLRTHYSRVREELMARREECVRRCGDGYVTQMLQGLGHWVDAADRGHLTWGILDFVKCS